MAQEFDIDKIRAVKYKAIADAREGAALHLRDLATVKGTLNEDGSHTLTARGKTASCQSAGDVQAFLQGLPDKAEADRVMSVGLKTPYSPTDVTFTFGDVEELPGLVGLPYDDGLQPGVIEKATRTGPVVCVTLQGGNTVQVSGLSAEALIAVGAVGQPAASHRGHPMDERGGVWVYTDTGEPVAGQPERQCGHCRLPNRPDGHDACLGEIPGAMNACCGHGVSSRSYIQWPEKSDPSNV